MNSSTMNSYELGTWAFPILVTNLILLSIGILYRGKILPEIITNPIKFIFNFEISRKIALLTVLILLSIYVGFSISKVLAPELVGGDYSGAYQHAEQYNTTSFFKLGGETVQFGLNAISLKALGNIRIIPFIASISLLLLTYFLTREISQKRFAGIVSMVILLQSQLFLRYDTDYAYTNTWTLFFILSLYLIQRRQWHLSIMSYVLSVLSKALTAMFLPITFFFIYSSNIPRKTKIVNAVGFAALSVFIIAYARFYLTATEFHPAEFWTGFTALENSLRFDGLVLIFLLPLVVGLFVISRRGVAYADSVMVLILGVLFSSPLLVGLTDFTNQPYRLIPLVVFFAVGVGVLLSNRVNILRMQNRKLLSTVIFSATLIIVTINLIPVIFPSLIQGTYRIVLNG
ncbi:MAG: hypothetical protein KGI08_10570 [Thaumarchaeota archaeon]|nr:hypothetical protein [Nitrososphaerota archaeon]